MIYNTNVGSFLFVIYYIVSSVNDYRDTGIYKIMTTHFLRRDMMCHVHCSQTLVLTAYCADSQASYSSESASTVARHSANSSIEFENKSKRSYWSRKAFRLINLSYCAKQRLNQCRILWKRLLIRLEWEKWLWYLVLFASMAPCNTSGFEIYGECFETATCYISADK